MQEICFYFSFHSLVRSACELLVEVEWDRARDEKNSEEVGKICDFII